MEDVRQVVWQMAERRRLTLHDQRQIEVTHLRLAKAMDLHFQKCFPKLRTSPPLVSRSQRLQHNRAAYRYHPHALPEAGPEVDPSMKRLFEDLVKIWHSYDDLVEEQSSPKATHSANADIETAKDQLCKQAIARYNKDRGTQYSRTSMRVANIVVKALKKHGDRLTLLDAQLKAEAVEAEELAAEQAATIEKEAAEQRATLRAGATGREMFLPPFERAPARPYRPLQPAYQGKGKGRAP